MAGNKNLSLIQVFRGIASLLVVLYHISVNCQEIFHIDFLGNAFAFGRAGVDIFFVLSGFIITYTSFKHLCAPGNLFPFLKRRIIRIYPVYWIIITLFITAKIVVPFARDNSYNFTVGNLFSTYLLLPDHAMINGVSWTLSFELFFYLLFSLAFVIKSKKLLFILMITYSILVITLYYLDADYVNNNRWISFFLSPRNAEFFMGVAAALIIPKISGKRSGQLIITGIILFLTGVVLYDNNISMASGLLNRIVLFGFPSFVLIIGAARYEMNKNIAVNTILLSLGDASYSLYLIHLPVIVVFFKIFVKLNFQNTFLINIVALLFVGVICYGSILFFRFIEKPLITKLNGGKQKLVVGHTA